MILFRTIRGYVKFRGNHAPRCVKLCSVAVNPKGAVIGSIPPGTIGGAPSVDNRVLGRRLKTYRLAAGWSLRELSERLSSRVTAQALSLYETGQSRPRPPVLQALAWALGTNVEQLLREPNALRLRSIRFRHPVTLPPAAKGKVRAGLRNLIERSLTLEQRLGGEYLRASLPRIDAISDLNDPENAEELAQDVRRRWGLGTGPLPHLVSLFESRGIRVIEFVDEDKDQDLSGGSAFVSYSGASGLDFPVVFLNRSHWSERKRFTLCHELAHLILPSAMHVGLAQAEQERYANTLAGALLLPAARLREQLGRKRKALSWHELHEIKRQFGASYQAITYRCRQVGIIARDLYRSLFEEFRRLGWRDYPYEEHEPLDPSVESSTRLERLALRGITEGIISKNEAVMLLNSSPDALARLLAPPKY